MEVTQELVPYGRELFSRATYTVSIHRHPHYYVIKIVMPCCLMSCIAVLTYVLQPNRPERLAIG